MAIEIVDGQYTLGPISAPRVSSIIRGTLKSPYVEPDDFAGKTVMKRNMDRASARGNVLHEAFAKMMRSPSACWAIVKEYELQLAPLNGEPFIEAMARMIDGLPARIGPWVVMADELAVIGKEDTPKSTAAGATGPYPLPPEPPRYYGGTIDLVLAQPHAAWVWDLKCTAKCDEDYVATQTTAYARALERAKLHPLHNPIYHTAVVHCTAKICTLNTALPRRDEEWIKCVQNWYDPVPF